MSIASRDWPRTASSAMLTNIVAALSMHPHLNTVAEQKWRRDAEAELAKRGGGAGSNGRPCSRA